MKKLYSNKEIIVITQSLIDNFLKDSDLKLPSMINFAIQSNLKAFTNLSEVIEETKKALARQNGHYIPEQNAYQIDPDKIDYVQAELDKLFSLEQSVNVKMINLSDIKDIPLTSQQMNTLLFMIEEN